MASAKEANGDAPVNIVGINQAVIAEQFRRILGPKLSFKLIQSDAVDTFLKRKVIASKDRFRVQDYLREAERRL